MTEVDEIKLIFARTRRKLVEEVIANGSGRIQQTILEEIARDDERFNVLLERVTAHRSLRVRRQSLPALTIDPQRSWLSKLLHPTLK